MKYVRAAVMTSAVLGLVGVAIVAAAAYELATIGLEGFGAKEKEK